MTNMFEGDDETRWLTPEELAKLSAARRIRKTGGLSPMAEIEKRFQKSQSQGG